MTISYIIPSLIGLDKALETLDTNYTHFNRALRSGLCIHFQDLIHQNEMIIATVLDPRIKLQVMKYSTSVTFRFGINQDSILYFTVLDFIKPASCLEATWYSPHHRLLLVCFFSHFPMPNWKNRQSS